MLDLTKLTPAPWYFAVLPTGNDVIAAGGFSVLEHPYDVGEADGRFIALARNAFDVLLRRGWWVVPNYAGRPGTFWRVRICQDYPIENQDFADPFTALVEADAWYKANVETKP